MNHGLDLVVAILPVIAAVLLLNLGDLKAISALTDVLGLSHGSERHLRIGLVLFLLFLSGCYTGWRFSQIT